tara:strand:- start:1223 stop:1804 length:582 start_codon:yes stop_codon:yes gene_type:complete
MKATNLTREQWLNEATNIFRTETFKRNNISIPEDVKVSCGFAPNGNRSALKTLGVCHPRSHSKANVNEIFISPATSDSSRVLDILAHELIHAVDNCKNGHRKPFKDMADAIGLTGQMRSTEAGEELKKELDTIIKRIGDYPHAEILLNSGRKQSTRNIKVSCKNCEFSFRTSRKNIELMQYNFCVACGCDSLG